MARAAATQSSVRSFLGGLFGSYAPQSAATAAASSIPVAAASSVSSSSLAMHRAFARLFSTNLSSGAHTPFAANLPSTPRGVGFPMHQHNPQVPQSTPVGLRTADSATTTTDEHHLDNFDISPQIKAALRQNFKIESLFPVQAECYTPIVSGKDLIGRSKTGHKHNMVTFCALFPPPSPCSQAPLYQFLLLLMSSDKMAWWQHY